jgi:hypothetical protein
MIGLMLAIVGIIHLLPVTGVLGASNLNALYGIMLDESNATILLRHRAALFGILGLFLLYSAFKYKLHGLGLLAGFLSVISFLLISFEHQPVNAAIQRVIMVDLIALGCLILGGILQLIHRRKRRSENPFE